MRDQSPVDLQALLVGRSPRQAFDQNLHNLTRIRIVFHCYETGIFQEIPPGDWSHMVAAAWVGYDWVADAGVRRWVRLFRATGFLTDRSVVAPTHPLTVYRGSTRSRQRRMSWTTNFERAKWFALREAVFGRASHVWKTSVAPQHVLAMFFDRTEDEVVVSPWGLGLIEEIGDLPLIVKS